MGMTDTNTTTLEGVGSESVSEGTLVNIPNYGQVCA